MATQVTLDAAKFDRLFTSIERQMIMQSSFLESIYNIQSYQLDLDKEREETRRRELDLLRMRPTEEDNRPSGQPGGGAAEDVTPASGISNILGRLMGLGIAGAELFSFRNVIGAGLAVALAGPIEDFLTGALGTALENAGLSSEFANSMGNALGQAGAWATIGSVFGKKAALWFGVAGAASSIFSDEIGRVFDANKDGVATAFGVEMSPEAITGIGTAMGLGAAAMLRYGPIQSKLLMGVATLMSAYGDDAAKWLEEQTGIPADFSAGAIDALSGAAYGASLLGMFGPTGMIIGAIAGFAVVAGNAFYEWVKAEGEKNRAANLARMQAEFEQAKTDYELGVDKPRAAESMAQVGIQDIQDVATGVATEEQTQRIGAAIEAMKTQDPERAKDLQIAYDRAIEGVMPSEYGEQLTGNRNEIEDQFVKAVESYLSGGMGMGYIDQYAQGGGNAEAARNAIRAESFSADVMSTIGEDRVNALLDQILSNNGIMPVAAPKPSVLTSAMLSATEQRLIAEANKIKPSEVAGLVSSMMAIGNNSGNVNRGGDSIVTNVTNIYGTTADKALNAGNSVPAPQYAVP